MPENISDLSNFVPYHLNFWNICLNPCPEKRYRKQYCRSGFELTQISMNGSVVRVPYYICLSDPRQIFQLFPRSECTAFPASRVITLAMEDFSLMRDFGFVLARQITVSELPFEALGLGSCPKNCRIRALKTSFA